MDRKTVKLIAIIISAVFILGIFGPMAYIYVFSTPTTQNEQPASAEVTELQARLREVNSRLSAAEQLEKKIIEESGNRFRIMCEKGRLSYLDIIFSAKSLSDFTDRIVIAREISEYDKNMMNAIKKIKDEISITKAEAEKLASQLEAATVNTDTLQ